MIPSDRRRETYSRDDERAYNLERLKPVAHVVDLIQISLEGVYGLQDLHLERASDFMWPKRTSKAAEKTIAGDIQSRALKAFFITDSVPIRQSPLQKIKQHSLMHRDFKDHHPVIYVPLQFSESTRGVEQISGLLSGDKIEVLEILGEEVGHFVYQQTQHRLHHVLPGAMVSEIVGFIDLYQLIKSACSEAHIDISDINNPAAVRALEYFKKKRDKFKNVGNPELSYYRDSAAIIDKYLDYLIAQETLHQDATGGVRRFYRLNVADKLKYLNDLYVQLEPEKERHYENWFYIFAQYPEFKNK